ncbi:hypothetical protein [Vibrio mediterranei]|uniref:hypothetical protein n=1 Tax=Vibrio mediterranei TaxID=689 RepID=UPI001EFCC97D|nr:hypothetical protein [Vibrio mediterranei]MCG9658259.1 hypothetical protein [Vibrio mediterranei]
MSAHFPSEHNRGGTPLDYSSDMYRFYFEVMDVEDIAYRTLLSLLGSRYAYTLKRLPYGYEAELPIQCVPDVLRTLSVHNIAVYQVVRNAKTAHQWYTPDEP